MEKDLRTSNSRWFEYKLGDFKHKFSVAKLRALSLEKVIDDLNIIVSNLTTKVEFLKKKMVRVKDKAIGYGIEAGFKIFCLLKLKLHPNFDIVALEARVTTKVVGRAMDEVEKAVAANRGATGPSRGG